MNFQNKYLSEKLNHYDKSLTEHESNGAGTEGGIAGVIVAGIVVRGGISAATHAKREQQKRQQYAQESFAVHVCFSFSDQVVVLYVRCPEGKRKTKKAIPGHRPAPCGSCPYAHPRGRKSAF